MTDFDTQSPTALAPDNALGHAGELRMRSLFPSRLQWDEQSLRSMMRPTISPSLAAFIEAQPFFFIATADAEGHCDASFRGRERDASGNALPVLKVVDDKTLVFPDFSGNGLYNSLGNMTANPHIGMLFVDFERQRRARVNGIADIARANAAIRDIWPTAQGAVFVTVEQAFGNCPARIPKLVAAADRHA